LPKKPPSQESSASPATAPSAACASLYNAVTLEAVEALVSFLREFRRTRG
jgi:phosphoserine aminotransferase